MRLKRPVGQMNDYSVCSGCCQKYPIFGHPEYNIGLFVDFRNFQFSRFLTGSTPEVIYF